MQICQLLYISGNITAPAELLLQTGEMDSVLHLGDEPLLLLSMAWGRAVAVWACDQNFAGVRVTRCTFKNYNKSSKQSVHTQAHMPTATHKHTRSHSHLQVYCLTGQFNYVVILQIGNDAGLIQE